MENSAHLARQVSVFTRVHLVTPYTYLCLFLFCFFSLSLATSLAHIQQVVYPALNYLY